MGFDNKTEGKYFTIFDGKFSQRVKEGTEGAVQRTNKIGKVVFEKYYDRFTAKLVDIKVTDGAYGKSWEFHFLDGNEIYKLQLGYSNSFATAFLKILPNVDLSSPITLSPSVKEVDGKNRSTLFVNQNGQAIKHAYTKDNPNGLPDMEQITVKGSAVWDDTKRIAFLQEMVNTKILPQLKRDYQSIANAGISGTGAEAPAQSFEDSIDEVNASVADDQPF